MTSSPPENACPICSRIDNYYEIENPQDRSTTDDYQSFPAIYRQLTSPNPALQRHYQFSREYLLHCPACRTYFWYADWAPGGSEDVMHTYIHEAYTRLSFFEAHKKLQDARYRAFKDAQTYGGEYQTRYEQTTAGVEQEKEFLKTKACEIIEEALNQIADRYAHSRSVAEMLGNYPPAIVEKQIAELREREEKVAAYHAEMIAEYLPEIRASDLPAAIQHRLTTLLDDHNAEVVAIIQAALQQRQPSQNE